jgi:hypothetical protein
VIYRGFNFGVGFFLLLAVSEEGGDGSLFEDAGEVGVEQLWRVDMDGLAVKRSNFVVD